MTKAVMIDLDNTLIETQILYTQAKDALSEFVSTCCGESGSDITTWQQDRQMVLFKTMGYGSGLLPQSYEDTLRHFVPDATPDEVRYARSLAWNVYATDAAIKDGVAQALHHLAPHYTLYLVTVGDETVQQRRIDMLPFKHLFKETFIVPHKNSKAYKNILKTCALEPEEAVMIGDSLASDILPAVAAGMKAIYIPADNWQAREMGGKNLPKTGVKRYDSFSAAVIALVLEKSPEVQKKPPHRPPPPSAFA